MTGAKCGSGSAYPSGTPKIIPHLVFGCVDKQVLPKNIVTYEIVSTNV